MSFPSCASPIRTAQVSHGSSDCATISSTFSAVTIGELQRGIERVRKQGTQKALEIANWVDQPALEDTSILA